MQRSDCVAQEGNLGYNPCVGPDFIPEKIFCLRHRSKCYANTEEAEHARVCDA